MGPLQKETSSDWGKVGSFITLFISFLWLHKVLQCGSDLADWLHLANTEN